ncbi:hypothetical protein L0337_08870 [candidate division KSB1 bacterium]|nr:hypothetical protein [candidate division KSB1 bacterium]
MMEIAWIWGSVDFESSLLSTNRMPSREQINAVHASFVFTAIYRRVVAVTTNVCGI